MLLGTFGFLMQMIPKLEDIGNISQVYVRLKMLLISKINLNYLSDFYFIFRMLKVLNILNCIAAQINPSLF